MTTQSPDVIIGKRYTIAETAKLLGIPRRRLYYHVKKGYLNALRRNIDGRMVTDGGDILIYWHNFY